MKQKILFVDNFYSIKRDGSNTYYSIVPSGNFQQYKPLFENKNINLVLNFQEQKDLRSQDKQEAYALNFDLSKFTKQDAQNFLTDFSFNVSPSALTKFNLYLGTEKIQNSNNTFNFNGKFVNIHIPETAPFSTYNFNFNDSKHKLTRDNNHFSGDDWPSIKIDNNKIKELNIEGLEDFIDFNEITSKSLNKIKLKDLKEVHLNLNNFEMPSIKTIDLKDAKYIKLITDIYSLDFLKFDFSSPSTNESQHKANQAQEQLIKLHKIINLNCDIILSADSYIEWEWFPRNKKLSSKYHEDPKAWKVKDLFDCKGKSTITLKPIDFLMYYYNNQKAFALKELKSMDKIICDLQKETKKSQILKKQK